VSETRDTFLFAWWHRADSTARRALIVASLGWMLDAFDVMLFILVQKSIMADLHFDSKAAGWLQCVTLLAAAAGGIGFGLLADRWGRVRAMTISVLLYSVFTAACGFANSWLELAVFRACLGLGMGGEWASGAALVSETWSDRDRGKALGFMQSSWAIGYACAAAVNWLVQDLAGLNWRTVFFIGVLPALFAFWIRRRIPEPALWLQARKQPAVAPIRKAFSRPLLGITVAVTLMNACTLFGWWGFNGWVPSYLISAPEEGGIGLGVREQSALVIFMQVGMWLGYVTFGFVSDAVGRRRTYVVYLLLASALVWLYAYTRNPWLLFALGPVAAFFATGYFSGFAAVTAELYPTAIRASAQGFCYNLGRIVSAFAPLMAGGLVKSHGYPLALSITAAAFLFAAGFWFFIPETRGTKILPDSSATA
jgi:MFS family permease